MTHIANLNFQEPKWSEIPCLELAKQVALAGGALPIVMNAANEVAVEHFIKKTIGFTEIYSLIDKVLYGADLSEPQSIDDVLAIDSQARIRAVELMH